MSITDCQMIEEIIAHIEYEMEDRIIFKQLKYLGLKCLPNLRCFYSRNCTIEFPSLQQVVLQQCQNMKIFSAGILNTPKLQRLQIIEAENGGYWEGNLNTTIQKLFKDMFHLVNLSTLRHIWKKNQPQVFSFRTLTLMEVYNCNSLRYVFTPSVVSGIVQLQKMEIKNCAMMEEIITMEGENDAAIDKITLFPKLNQLKLKNLPELTIVCNFYGNLIELPSLLKLWIENCPKMQTFVSNHQCTDMTASKEHEEMEPHSDILPFFDEKFPLLSCYSTLDLFDAFLVKQNILTFAFQME
ncbi:hypothetical protein Dsin_019172 [Dipteronia sinensis]|uniref:Disease resistance protein At4g27190-like leucine-rich repeats domain-containing protein n=1 Tax=Dipteronia sinensis TaxID=43782 RepID=A0AAE0A874_9ROSI|nr:hypothetical protein Dsin_019172 [Dipteronia sinensis]